VHRALANGSDAPLDSRESVRQHIERQLRPFERALVEDANALIDRAARAYSAIVGRPEIAQLLVSADVSGSAGLGLPALSGVEGSRVFHELPFSLKQPDGTIVRGAMDAVVERPGGGIEVIEIKTGRRLPEHQRQLALYVEAARTVFPDREVSGRLVYPDEQLSAGPGV
jgi:hypothetical protein